MPMDRLPLVGVITYNSVDFDAYLEGVRAPVEARYVYDRAGRVVVHVEYTVNVKGVVSAEAADISIDDYMSYLRRALSQPGAEMRFAARGFGLSDFQVNRPGGQQWDVDWGPKPEVLSWTSLGGGRAAEFTWRCKVCIPECPGGPNLTRYKGGIKEVNYSWQVQLDRVGMATLTINGYAKIPQTRIAAGNNQLQDTADRLLEACVGAIPCPVGFRRESQNHQVDESKNQITWTTVYKELHQIPLPFGVVDCQASHEIGADMGQESGMQKWSGTISASYTLDKVYQKADCWRHFCQLVDQRLSWAWMSLGMPARRTDAYMITGLSAKNPDIYGAAAGEFSLRYWIIVPLQNAIEAAGLWSVPNAQDTWPLWRLSLRGGAGHPRGYYKLGLVPADDVMVNLCKPGVVETPVRQRVAPPVQGVPPGILQDNLIPPEISWLLYEFWLEWEEDDGVIEHTPLDEEKEPGKPNPDPPKPLPDPGSSTAGWTDEMWKLADEYGKYVQGGGKLTWQQWLVKIKGYKPPAANKPKGHGPRYSPGTLRSTQQGRPGLTLYLKGRAVRAGYPIDCPVISSVGGVTVQRANRAEVEFFRVGVVGSYFGVPLYYAVWRQRYIFPRAPQVPVVPPVPQPNNPLATNFGTFGTPITRP